MRVNFGIRGSSVELHFESGPRQGETRFVDYRSASPPGLTAYAAPCITCVLPG